MNNPQPQQNQPQQQAQQPAGSKQRQSDMTHTYLRDMYLAHYPETCFSLGEWRRYSGGIWPALPEWQVKSEMQNIIEQEARSGKIITSLSTRLLSSVYELTRIKATLPDQKFDADHDLIVFKNHALRISTKQQENHTPLHYATTRLEFDYDADALCPTWLTLLDNLDINVVPFLQEFAGYALTLDTRHEVAVWLHGLPGGGKSTFLNGITGMMGNRAGVLDLPDLERSTFALTNIIGKTLVVSAEQPSEFMRSTSVINRIISGEQITVDLKYRDPIVIRPHAKIVWAMNEMPRIKEAGSGLFRRVKVIEFPKLQTIDPDVKEYRIPSEVAGIFNWAIAGLDRLNKRGRFEVPDVVIKATDDFQASNDVPAMFIAECCIRDNNREILSGSLYQAYKQWCFDNGHSPQSSTGIAREWKRLGLIFTRQAGTGARMWRGITLI